MSLFPKRKTKDLDTNNHPIISKTLQQRKRSGPIASRNKAFGTKTDTGQGLLQACTAALQQDDSDRAPLDQSLPDGADVGVLELAPDRDPARKPADLDPARAEQAGDGMGGGLTLVGESWSPG
jgi:hypothetical protein